ncbi:uncharacterized protein PAC_18693 [Phialocephala subalpina]|uniref:AMP-dependent synthetase/ligase domain-containing protein n=1 Tax=Phialocephala subalpina TaxID=576137 RepID=A0A1L7XUV3_9HELO|nr:uncharacterized protein PAC_18693 [Phialocephala subalpina]
MVIKSRYLEPNLPSVDIYTFLFKRKDRKFPEMSMGDVLAISLASDIDMPPIIFGALWAGVIVSTANPGYTLIEISYQLCASGVKAIVTHFSKIEDVRKPCSAVGIPEDHIIILGDGKNATGRFKHWTNVRNLANTAQFVARKIDLRKDASFLVYAGTTGKPEGV